MESPTHEGLHFLLCRALLTLDIASARSIEREDLKGPFWLEIRGSVCAYRVSTILSPFTFVSYCRILAIRWDIGCQRKILHSRV